MKTALMRSASTLIVCGFLMAISPTGNANDPEDNYAEIRAAISKFVPAGTDMEIQPTAMENMLEVLAGSNVFYVSSDGGFLFNGPLYALDRGENLTDKRLAEYRKSLLKDIAAIQPVEYPAGNAKQKITVITDIDCTYCRHLHQEMDKYHQAGLDVEYVMSPRGGKDSASYVKTVNAICAAKPDEAITAAMNGATPVPAQCDHPIDKHMEMARAMGAASTPNIVMPDGTLIRGYKTAAELSRLLAAAGQQQGSP
jgi:thiol:disulfide interchange protein DsbC